MQLLDSYTEQNLRKFLPSDVALRGMADFFEVFADSTRLKILCALSVSPLCVGDLADLIDKNQTTVSHQLKNLKAQKLVDYSRQGKTVFYNLTAECPSKMIELAVEYIFRGEK